MYLINNIIHDLKIPPPRLIYTKNILLFLFPLLLMYSCKSEVPEVLELKKADTPSILSQIKLKDGRLIIPDISAYQKLFEFYAKNQGSDTWELWIAKFERKGFVSIRDAYEALTEEDERKIETNGTKGYDNILVIRRGGDGELEADIQVPTPLLDRIINSKGILQIGNQVSRYFYDYYLA